jgi:hypothetical protein
VAGPALVPTSGFRVLSEAFAAEPPNSAVAPSAIAMVKRFIMISPKYIKLIDNRAGALRFPL